MSAGATPCPDDGAIAALADGALEESERDAVERHVAACGSCARVIAELARLVSEPEGNKGEDGLAIGRYVLSSPLGSGGMGMVVEAWDPMLSRRVAIKLVRPDRRAAPEVARRRVLAEARALASVADPHVLAIHDVIDGHLGVCLVTELVDGDPGQTWVERARPHWRDIVGACIQAGRGLAAVHARGLFHGDVKPSNLLVGIDGRVRLGDFGLATAEGRARGGTPGFMAPEQSSGSAIDARADQFALAMTAIAMLRGRPVDAGTPPGALELPDGAPAELAAALARGICARPSDRFASAGEFVAALERAISTRPRRPRIALAVAALAALAVLAVVLWIATRDRSDDATRAEGTAGSAAVLAATQAPTPPSAGPTTSPPPGAGATPSPGASVAQPAPSPGASATPSPGASAVRTAAPGPSPGASATPAQPSPPSKAPPPRPTVVAKPEPAAPPAMAARDAVMEALRNGDGPACAAAIERLRVEEPSFPSSKTSAYCQMLLGKCVAALPAIAAEFGAGPARELAYEYCPPDGDLPEERLRRASKQARFQRTEAGCRRRATWNRYARTPEEDAQFTGIAIECWGALRRCDEARALATALAARLTKVGRSTELADVARWLPHCAAR